MKAGRRKLSHIGYWLPAILITFLFLVCNARADAIWTSGHHIIDADNLYDGGAYMYNDSSADMYSGYMHLISTYDTTAFILHDGHITEFKTYGNSAANILGGEITALDAGALSTINIYDVLITNGLRTLDNSVCNLYGGQINGMLGASGNSIINLYAFNVQHTTTGGRFGFGQITGEYNLGGTFIFDLPNDEVYSHINIIPEPTIFMLLSLGSLVLRKNK